MSTARKRPATKSLRLKTKMAKMAKNPMTKSNSRNSDVQSFVSEKSGGETLSWKKVKSLTVANLSVQNDKKKVTRQKILRQSSDSRNDVHWLPCIILHVKFTKQFHVVPLADCDYVMVFKGSRKMSRVNWLIKICTSMPQRVLVFLVAKASLLFNWIMTV